MFTLAEKSAGGKNWGNYGLKNEREQAEHVRCWSRSVCTTVPRIDLEELTEAVLLQRNV